MTKKEKKEINKKQRVLVPFNTGTRTFKSKNDYRRIKRWSAEAVVLLCLMFLFTTKVYAVSEEEIKLIASITTAEAINQCEKGQRFVIDTVLNRVDDEKFPNTIDGVINQKNQYSKGRPIPSSEMISLVREEVENRSNYDIIYFRTTRYHSFGTPVEKVGDHYFSKK